MLIRNINANKGLIESVRLLVTKIGVYIMIAKFIHSMKTHNPH